MGADDHIFTAQEEIDHFHAIPWCARHLAAPDLVVVPAYSRTAKPRREDALMSTTLRTRDTIAAFVLFYPRSADEAALLPEIRALVTLGALLGGHPGLAHGGVVATLLDEMTSAVAPQARQSRHQTGLAPIMTAYLHVSYRKPVPLPQTYLLTARYKGAEGRKIFMDAFMEDEAGERVAEAEALFIQVRSKI